MNGVRNCYDNIYTLMQLCIQCLHNVLTKKNISRTNGRKGLHKQMLVIAFPFNTKYYLSTCIQI